MWLHDLSNRHIDMPDTFQKFFRRDSGKDDHECILVSGDPYVTSVLDGSKFGLAYELLVYLPKTSTKFTPSMYVFWVLLLLVCMPSSRAKWKNLQPITWWLGHLWSRLYAQWNSIRFWNCPMNDFHKHFWTFKTFWKLIRAKMPKEEELWEFEGKDAELDGDLQG